MPKHIRAIVTPDKHAPLHDRAAISILKQAIELVKPDIYIDLGDFGEFGSISHWQWKRKKKPPLEYILPKFEEDYAACVALMDEIDESLDKAGVKEKYFIQGNHDEWVDRFIQEHPYLTQYEFSRQMEFAERGYTYYKAGRFLNIGDLHFYHGHLYGGQHHAKNHIARLGVNIMYGHHHDLQHASMTHMDGPKHAYSIGCLKSMSDEDNGWLGGRKINWSHAFAIVDFIDGKSSVSIVEIIDGQASIWGQLLHG